MHWRHRTAVAAFTALVAFAACGDGSAVTTRQEAAAPATTAGPVERVVWDGLIVSDDSPVVRLEQTPGGGFDAQTWDIGGNEANFFVRDATNQSRLPFRVQPGAPTDSLLIESSGEIGIGTPSPEAGLHVVRADGGKAAIIETRSDTTERRIVLELSNNGAAVVALTNTARASSWEIAHTPEGSLLLAGPQGSSAAELMPDGHLVLGGTVVEDAGGEHIVVLGPADTAAVLEALLGLPIESWRYPADSRLHLGPTTEGFLDVFGLGDWTGIAGLDATGVALAALQALAAEHYVLTARVAELESVLADLTGGGSPG